MARIYETAGAAITKMTCILDEKDRKIAQCNKTNADLKMESTFFKEVLEECGNVVGTKRGRQCKVR